MTPVSSALAHAHQLLRNDMLTYIDNVVWLATEHDDETALAVARAEVPRLVEAIRGALANHRADVSGLCLGCAPTWADSRFVRQNWPCPVVDGMHEHLKHPERVLEAIPHAP